MKEWNLENLSEAVKTSVTIAEALLKMDRIPQSNYSIFHRYIKKFNIDTSHFLGSKRPRPKTSGVKRYSLEELLVDNCFRDSKNIKKRLLDANLLKYECYTCGISEWMNKKISLEMDHIDGNKFNNQLSNLRILCPNCHSQTNTYCSKNSYKQNKDIPTHKLCKCGEQVVYNSSSCFNCLKLLSEQNILIWPSQEILLQKLSYMTFKKLAKEIGCGQSTLQRKVGLTRKMIQEYHKQKQEQEKQI